MVPILKIGVWNTHEFKSHLILNKNVTDTILVKKLAFELQNRITILICSICLVTILTVLHTNEIITILLNPIKNIHTDWHMELIYNVLNTSFEQYDTDYSNVINKKNGRDDFDYIPVIEVNMNVSNASIAIIKIILHISILWTITILKYQLFLICTPSLYKKEQKTALINYIKEICIIAIAVTYTQEVWAYIYFNMSLHNYNEFNFYEFDVDFDVNEYINRYITAIYVHIAILNIKKTHIIASVLLLVVVIGIIKLFELLYVATIFVIIKKTHDAWINIISNNRRIKDLKKHYIIRINRDNK